MGGAILVAIRVTVEAGGALAGNLRLAIVGGIELLLREWRQQQAQALDLAWRQDTVEHLEVVGERDQLALRDVAEVRSLHQIRRRGKRCQKPLRQVEVYIESAQVKIILALHGVDFLC